MIEVHIFCLFLVNLHDVYFAKQDIETAEDIKRFNHLRKFVRINGKGEIQKQKSQRGHLLPRYNCDYKIFEIFKGNEMKR